MFSSGGLLKEKNPSFISNENARMQGNVYISASPNSVGDGSLSLDGTLYSDSIASATNNSNVIVSSPFHFIEQSPPSFPPQGKIQLYSSSANESRLFMVNYNGLSIDLNPLAKRGDIMTFDSTISTTTRLPIGNPDEVLTIDESGSNTSLAWKAPITNTNLLIEPSSQYIQYLSVSNDTTFSSVLSNTLVSINFKNVTRRDSGYTINSSNTFTISNSGLYHFQIKTGVGFNNNTNATKNSSIQILLQENTGSGFLAVNGTSSYTMLSQRTVSDEDSKWTTISTECVLEVSGGNQYRVMICELTSTGNIVIYPSSSSFQIKNILMDATDVSEACFIKGTNGNFQTLTGTPTNVTLNSVVTKTNGSDSLSANALTFNNTGIRYIFGKISVSTINVQGGDNVRVRLSLLKNGTVIPNSISEMSLVLDTSGTQLTGSTSVFCTSNFNGSDSVTMQAYILSQSQSATVALIQGDTSLGSILYKSSLSLQTQFQKFDASVASLTSLPNNNYLSLPLDTFAIMDSNYSYTTSFPGIVQVIEKGTYCVGMKATIKNNSSQLTVSGVRILIDSGSGFVYSNNSKSLIEIPIGLSESINTWNTIYVPDNSRILFQIMGDTSSLQLIANSTRISIYKLEYTISSTPSMPNFGELYNNKDDSQLQLMTAGIPISRLQYSNYFKDGTYKIIWTFDYDMSKPSVSFTASLVVDNSVQIDTFTYKPDTIGIFRRFTSQVDYIFESGTHTIDLMLNINGTSRSLSTKNINIESYRIL